MPGEIRRTQNWIGAAGSTLATAAFVPPPPDELPAALANLESYIHSRDPVPMLIRCGMVHAQFETIHPLLDGNGRLGRLIITFMLCERGVLRRPLLYLSAYLKEHRSEYYDRLTRVREEGDWEGWLEFFLTGVEEVATGATATAQRVLALRRVHLDLIGERLGKKLYARPFLDLLFRRPVVNAPFIERELRVAGGTANALLNDFERLDLLKEISGKQRDRVYRYQPYLDALSPAPEPGAGSE